MLKYFFESMTPVSRTEHMALQLDLKAALAEHAMTQAELAVVQQELSAVAEHERQVIEQRDIAQELLTRALTQLAKVDPKRTGGVPMREAIANILKDATEHGLWGELSEGLSS